MCKTRIINKYDARRFGLLAFLFITLNCRSQPIHEIIDLTQSFYSQKTLSYSFEKKWYINNGKVLWHFYSNYLAYRKGKRVYYLLESEILKDKFKCEVIKNSAYYGSNIIRSTSRYYRDYYFQDRDPMDGNDSGCVFNQSDSFKFFLNKKQFKTRVFDLDSLYLLELHDTLEIESNLPGITSRNKITKYYISKKNGSVRKCFLQISMEMGGHIQRTDSAIYTYRYYHLPRKKVIDKINSFKTLPEVDENALKKKLTDSIEVLFKMTKVFPDFILSDTSNNSYASTNIKAKYVLVDFWYKNCGPCLINMKNVEAIRQSFDSRDLEVIAINTQDSLDEDLRKKILQFNTHFVWLVYGKQLCRDLNVYAYPTTYIYNNITKDIIYRFEGTTANYSDNVKEILKKYITPK